MSDSYEKRAEMDKVKELLTAEAAKAEAEGHRMIAEAELTKQRGILATNPDAVRMLTQRGGDVEVTQRHELAVMRAKNEGPGWLPRLAVALMYAATLSAFVALDQEKAMRAYLLIPILFATAMTALLLTRRPR
jgi:hypothetical protein